MWIRNITIFLIVSECDVGLGDLVLILEELKELGELNIKFQLMWGPEVFVSLTQGREASF